MATSAPRLNDTKSSQIPEGTPGFHPDQQIEIAPLVGFAGRPRSEDTDIQHAVFASDLADASQKSWGQIIHAMTPCMILSGRPGRSHE